MTIFDVLPGYALGLIFLTVPGYFLTLAFFTENNKSKLERFILSVLLSITFLPLLLLIENQVIGIAINLTSVLATTLIIILFGLGFYLKKRKTVKNFVKINPFE